MKPGFGHITVYVKDTPENRLLYEEDFKVMGYTAERHSAPWGSGFRLKYVVYVEVDLMAGSVKPAIPT